MRLEPMTADALAAATVATFAELLAYVVECDLPAYGFEIATRLAQERLRDALGVVGEVEGVTALIAEKVAVDAGLVAVVAANDLGAVRGGAYAEGGLAPVAAVGADGADVIHLPRAGLVSIST